MKLRSFYATDGDCLLLTSSDGHHALIDGGRAGSFETQTWPVLLDLAKANEPIDLLVVSHIDADHISGILWLLKIVAAWAVYDYQTTEGGNPSFPKPAVSRPPAIARLWHNSWRAQLDELADPVEAYLARVNFGLETTTADRSDLSEAALKAIEGVEDLAESIPQGVELLRIVDDETPIPRNTRFDGRKFRDDLVLLDDPPYVGSVGTAKLTVIGPAKKHLQALQDEWREWLSEAAGAPPEALPVSPGGHELGFGGSVGVTGISTVDPAESEQLVESLIQAADVITQTDPSKVTPPNRASITLLAEENGRTCLLTGDAAEEELVDGLREAGRIVDGSFWCNVVKVQHHGSEHNLSEDFAKTVLAEHYVLCGDGAHGNPEPSVIKTIIETRRAADARPFTLWFNCSPARTRPNRRKELRAAIKEATTAAGKHPGITVNVLDDAQASHEIPV